MSTRKWLNVRGVRRGENSVVESGGMTVDDYSVEHNGVRFEGSFVRTLGGVRLGMKAKLSEV